MLVKVSTRFYQKHNLTTYGHTLPVLISFLILEVQIHHHCELSSSFSYCLSTRWKHVVSFQIEQRPPERKILNQVTPGQQFTLKGIFMKLLYHNKYKLQQFSCTNIQKNNFFISNVKPHNTHDPHIYEVVINCRTTSLEVNNISDKVFTVILKMLEVIFRRSSPIQFFLRGRENDRRTRFQL